MTKFIFSTSILSFGMLLIPFTAFADSWSLDSDKEHPPESDENRIIKWCNEDGTHTRYASANLKIKGYQPCGSVTSVVTCDASGTRMIGGNGEKRPRGHRDCSIGPRLVVLSYSDEDTIDKTYQAQPDEKIEALTPEEEKKLQEEFKDAQKKHQESQEKQMQAMTNQLLQQLGLAGNAPGKKPSNEKKLGEIFKNLDPQSRKRVKKMLE